MFDDICISEWRYWKREREGEREREGGREGQVEGAVQCVCVCVCACVCARAHVCVCVCVRCDPKHANTWALFSMKCRRSDAKPLASCNERETS